MVERDGISRVPFSVLCRAAILPHLPILTTVLGTDENFRPVQLLRRILVEYVSYFNEGRPHQGLEQDTPEGLKLVSSEGISTVVMCWEASSTITIARLPEM